MSFGKRRDIPCARDRSSFVPAGPVPTEIAFRHETVNFRASVAPPYGWNWKCFWGFVERKTLDVWFEFGVDRTLRSWFLAFLVKWAPPAKFRRLLRTNGMEYRNIARYPLSYRYRDHVWRFSWDLEKICRKSSEKCVLKKIQNGGKKYPYANGRGLSQNFLHIPRNSGKKEFWFSDIRFKSYRPKRKVGCYSATMRPTEKRISQ